MTQHESKLKLVGRVAPGWPASLYRNPIIKRILDDRYPGVLYTKSIDEDIDSLLHTLLQGHQKGRDDNRLDEALQYATLSWLAESINIFEPEVIETDKGKQLRRTFEVKQAVNVMHFLARVEYDLEVIEGTLEEVFLESAKRLLAKGYTILVYPYAVKQLEIKNGSRRVEFFEPVPFEEWYERNLSSVEVEIGDQINE